MAEVVCLVLQDAGFESASAPDRASAIDALANSGPFDGAIIDVWLKGEDGLEVADQLSHEIPSLPFLIMSGGGPGRSLEAVTARADALGAHAVLFKPVENDELLDAVKTMLECAARGR